MAILHYTTTDFTQQMVYFPRRKKFKLQQEVGSVYHLRPAIAAGFSLKVMIGSSRQLQGIKKKAFRVRGYRVSPVCLSGKKLS